MNKHNQTEYYRKRAAEYEQIYYRDIPPRRKEIDDEAARLKELARDKLILDIACGTGYWTEIMSQTAKEIVATDLSDEMIKMAQLKNYLCPVSFLQADLNVLPFENEQFELITLGFWFSHHPLQDYEQLFKNITRLLAPGGQIWLIDNNPPAEGPKKESCGVDEFGNNYKRRYLDNGEEFVIIKNYFERDELLKIFSKSFEINKIIYKTYYWSVVLTPS